MTDDDPYAISSDSDDDSDVAKKPPPKINIQGRSAADFKQIKESLTAEKKNNTRDENTLEEIAELKRTKSDQLSRFKEDFEKGTIKNETEEDGGESSSKMTTVERPTGIDKQTLSAFKDKFERMDATLELNLEERLKTMEKSLEGVGKENLSNMKNLYETLPNKEFTKEQIEELASIQRSEADKRRVLETFTQSENKVEKQKNCCICDKIVYPVEKIISGKRLYHTGCFKCSKCGKKLSSTTFNSHQGELFCRAHMLEVLHPERAKTTGKSEGDQDEEDEIIHTEEDDEFAVTSKPKQLGADVVRAGDTNIGDELQQLRSTLKGKKENWEQSVNESLHSAGKSDTAVEINTGTVKANLDKFISGGGEESNADDEEKRKQLEAICEQVSEVKNKWKTGEIEKAEVHETTNKEELEALKKGPKVRERFNERTEPVEESDVTKSYDRSELDTSNAAEARKSFLEGLAYQSGPVEKVSASELQDLKFEGLRSFKDKFEKGTDEPKSQSKAIQDIGVELKNIKQALESENIADMSPEARAERKKKEIEAEFLRYKLARKIQAKRQAEQEAGEEEQLSNSKEDIPTAEVGSIKNRFEGGEAFKSETTGKTELDVEIKMSEKARKKFKNIEAQASQAAPLLKSKGESKPSKWDKKTELTAEIVNKRINENDVSSDSDDNFDVKNLMNKFKNIENISPNKTERKIEELESLRIEAKNLRQRFEQQNGEEAEQSEEKKRQLEEEFRQLKEERERAKRELEEERRAEEEDAEGENQKDDVQVVADHASKMTAKWEKIYKKEAKKAQKSQMPQK